MVELEESLCSQVEKDNEEEHHNLALEDNVGELHSLEVEDNVEELHDLLLEDIEEELHSLEVEDNVEVLLIVVNYNLVVVDMDLDHEAYEAEMAFDYYTFELHFEDKVVDILVVVPLAVDLEVDRMEVDLEVDHMEVDLMVGP
jgi:hypothetical protein